MDNKPTSPEEMPVRFPGALSLKDLMTLVSVAVSLTIAWGVFGTRITIIEKDLETQKQTNARIEAEVDAVRAHVQQVERHQIDNDNMIDRLYEDSKIPQPKRRAEN